MPTKKKATKKQEVMLERERGILTYKPVVPLPGEEELFKDLEKYRQMVLALGASEAWIFPAREFPQDLRVWYRCQIPRCTASGANPYCPPKWRTPWPDAKRIKNAYRYAIVYHVNRPPEFWTGPDVWTRESNAAIAKWLPPEKAEAAKKTLDDYFKWQDEYRKIPVSERVTGSANIGPKIVAQARLDGHQFAATFGIGSCQFLRCGRYGAKCVALETGLCRYPLKVSPEGSAAMYQDFVTLNAKMGWKTYTAGHCVHPEDVPEGVDYFQVGSVFVE